MSATPQFASTIANAGGTVSTANTGRDGTGTLATILTAGASGTRIDDIAITAQGTTTAGMVRLFLSDGTTHRLWREIPVVAYTPSGTQPAFSSYLSGLGLLLKSGWSLRASTHNAEAFNVLVTNGGDL